MAATAQDAPAEVAPTSRCWEGHGDGAGACPAEVLHYHRATALAYMGNGAASAKAPLPDDYDYLRGLVPQLRRDAAEWQNKAEALGAEVLGLRRELKNREQEVLRLQREVHKLKVRSLLISLGSCRYNNCFLQISLCKRCLFPVTCLPKSPTGD